MDVQRYRAAERALLEHWGVEPTEHWVRLASTGTTVRVLEIGSGPPVLFVHGGSICGACWVDLVSRLGDHRCLLLDRPGCGLSEPLREPPGLEGMPAHADRLVADVLDGLGVDAAHVVANSMGGYFALRAAAAHPARVPGLVLFGWALGAPAPQHVPWIMRLGSLPGLSWLATRVPFTVATARAFMRAGGMADAVDAGAVPHVALEWNAAANNHTDGRANEYRMVGGIDVRRQVDALALPRTTLGEIVCPVEVVIGTEDPFGTVETMQALADALPRGELTVWQGAGHAPWIAHLDHAAAVVSQHDAGGGRVAGGGHPDGGVPTSSAPRAR